MTADDLGAFPLFAALPELELDCLALSAAALRLDAGEFAVAVICSWPASADREFWV